MNKSITQACMFIFVLAIILTGLPDAEAGFVPEECVTAVVQGINPSSVRIGDEFTLGINLEVCGGAIPEDVTFAITSIPPDIIVTEDLVTRIPKLYYSTSERYVRYHMRTTPDANPGPHVIKMELTYGKDISTTKHYEVEVIVIGEDAEPRISSVKTVPEYIYEGDSVDLRLGIENYGKAIAKSVVVSLGHEFMGIKDTTLGTVNINGSQTALFKFKASKAGEFKIPVFIEYEDDFGRQKDEYEIKLTVLDKKGSLNIASVKVDPVLPYMGDTVELTMRVENSGERTVNSIRVYTDHPFKGLKESFIGTLDPNEDGPAVVTFIADQTGEFEFPITITYIDDFGEEQIKTRVNLIILETDGGAGRAVVVLLVLAVIGGLVYYNYKTKKSKDKIIRQLMKGDSTEKKK
ncbi:S-layer domain-containing protein [Candidatus Methanoperedens nitroreducens]|uniref:S-layer domain-containing protein n=1 Tax=Candidatus Methanoperedens nitratireducens TaxID=1392998 RepID=A0A062V7K0_9EURY|nr:COG1361 S-layer family protein [Candidatus Methanoperedens nitroreducens]KCZ71355.1 S-layer domain-containing protein [Candidatus Methanoperedens nitroreducens]MDJ1420984.1 COG1361 S-layer family protein [Candidatus Methanoperedens sp.]